MSFTEIFFIILQDETVKYFQPLTNVANLPLGYKKRQPLFQHLIDTRNTVNVSRLEINLIKFKIYNRLLYIAFMARKLRAALINISITRSYHSIQHSSASTIIQY